MSIDHEALRRYLRKCEIEYIAEHSDGGETIEWLAPYCGTVEQIAHFLRGLGFHIKTMVDEEPFPGERHQWVETTSGVLVYANQGGVNGLVSKSRA